MQYWKPDGKGLFAGDMMPFWDGERFHLFYLRDHDHHADRDGLGGHQWAHASTSDLIAWQHHPLALPIGEPGTTDQNGICTGSIFSQDGVFHAFYATRIRRTDGSVAETICRASSQDLIHFDKSPDNPLFGAPEGLDPQNHRDPFVFRHAATGEFHMLVTASQEGRGVLAHYTSPDLDRWHYRGPFLALDKDPSPECPEHFFWNGWWYLVFSQSGELQYRVSRDPLGPWQHARRDTIEASTLTVPRTAAFTGNRRLAVGFLPWRRDERDEGEYVYAGNVVFRELIQYDDGTLSTRFVPEMMPPSDPRPSETVCLNPGDGGSVAVIPDIPPDAILSFRLVPQAGAGDYAVLLRAGADLKTGCRLGFHPNQDRVTLRRWPEAGPSRAQIDDLPAMGQGTEVVICLTGSIIDVCINGRRTLVERCFDYRGTHMGVYTEAGAVRVEQIRVSELTR